MSKYESSSYGNFKDPGGLAIRMLRKASYESVWPLLQTAATVAARPLDRIASRWERSDGGANESIPQVLIVGPPRSGTTLASQVLAQHLDVSYFPNVSALFPNATIWISKKCLGSFEFGPKSTKSFYGNTTGFRGINDGFHVWNRWLGKNRYRIDHVPSGAEADDLASFFQAWNAAFGKPLLNKNNRNADGIELLSKLLPDSYFVVLQRNLVATVQSLLKARQFIQGSTAVGWGLYSDRSDANADAVKSTCEQVVDVQRRINEQLARLDASRYLEVRYEDFCAAPGITIDRVINLVPGLRRRPAATQAELPTLKPSSTITLARTEYEYVKATLTRLGADIEHELKT